MKTNHLQNMVAVMAATGLTFSGITVGAQDSSATTTVQPAAISAPVPQLAYGVPQILQLAQAKVGDDTIIAYIRNSGNSYGLNAEQIIYLRQEGVSAAVINTMLNQPRPGVALAMPTTPAPPPVASPAYTEQAPPDMVAPPVTYAQTLPDTVYYNQPYYYYQPYYYPTYAWYPPVIYSFGWGGSYHYGGGWRGGWHGGGFGGGWHGGGSVGGWHGGAPSGGWHGGAPSGGPHGNGHR